MSKLGHVETVETVEAAEETKGSCDFIGPNRRRGSQFLAVCRDNSGLVISSKPLMSTARINRCFLEIANSSHRWDSQSAVLATRNLQ